MVDVNAPVNMGFLSSLTGINFPRKGYLILSVTANKPGEAAVWLDKWITTAPNPPALVPPAQTAIAPNAATAGGALNLRLPGLGIAKPAFVLSKDTAAGNVAWAVPVPSVVFGPALTATFQASAFFNLALLAQEGALSFWLGTGGPSDASPAITIAGYTIGSFIGNLSSSFVNGIFDSGPGLVPVLGKASITFDRNTIDSYAKVTVDAKGAITLAANLAET